MTCKHGFPAPTEAFWSGTKPPRCLECEIERLHAKIEGHANETIEMISTAQDLRQRIAELESELNAAQGTFTAKQSVVDDAKAYRELLPKYRERGERMKALYDAAQYADHDGRFDDWFEDGEAK